MNQIETMSGGVRACAVASTWVNKLCNFLIFLCILSWISLGLAYKFSTDRDLLIMLFMFSMLGGVYIVPIFFYKICSKLVFAFFCNWK